MSIQKDDWKYIIGISVGGLMQVPLLIGGSPVGKAFAGFVLGFAICAVLFISVYSYHGGRL